jgi:hypothetical protein
MRAMLYRYRRNSHGYTGSTSLFSYVLLQQENRALAVFHQQKTHQEMAQKKKERGKLGFGQSFCASYAFDAVNLGCDFSQLLIIFNLNKNR